MTAYKGIARFLAPLLCALVVLPVHAQTAAALSGGASNLATSNTINTTNAADAAFSGGAQAMQQSLAAPAAGSGKGVADAQGGQSAPAAQRVRGTTTTEISQFQRFVQESTGRLLPVFGRELFDGRQPYTADAALPAPADYLLGPGDEIRLQVVGPVDFVSALVIDRNGQVTLPKVGVVNLAGVAVRDLESTLRTSLSKVFTNFTASASLGKLRGIQVYVVGQAVQPGTLQVSSLSTLVSALFASGGPNVNGSMRNIELKRGGKSITTLDLYDFISRGDKSRDVALLSGDVIVIPPAGPRVAVSGALDQAAIYELKSTSNSVADILALSGGVPTLATTQRALLERISRISTPPRQVQELVLNDQGLRQPMMDGDVLTLLGISPAFGNAVTLQGAVADPLRYRWFEGMKVSDLLPEVEALITQGYYKKKNLLGQIKAEPYVAPKNAKDTTADLDGSEIKDSFNGINNRIKNSADQINWDYAVVERLDRTKLTTQLIPFNLGRVVFQKDAAQDVKLQAGDVVTVFNQNDLRLPQAKQTRLVRVEGEVAVPGMYQVAPGETLPQLIQRIGGLTTQAYLFGTELRRESVRSRQQENLNQLVRRLEAQAQSQQSTITANRSPADVAAAQLQLQAQQAQSKAQLDRLKEIRSNGRIALELDPQAAALASLPALPLENGDYILVPPTPGFVSAIGSVNNENAQIYKPSKTVADVIRVAGLTEDSEPGQAFLLRADGSVVSGKDRNSFFGRGLESLVVMPGDTLVVPAQQDRESRYTAFVRGAKDWTQILANLGLGAAGLKSLGY
jgi:protein involved in polysaccharide export with SLBB domain